jgi:small subunit ribosomal protein S14
MAKKSLIEREIKRKKLYIKYLPKRLLLLKQLKLTKDINLIFNIQKKLQKLPLNSIKVRLRNRCWKTGKARGFFRYFNLCRNSFRELALNCFLPGITKSSW